MTTLTIRLTENQKRELKARAAMCGMTLTSYIIARGLPKSNTKKKTGLEIAMEEVLNGEVESAGSVDEFLEQMKTW